MLSNTPRLRLAIYLLGLIGLAAGLIVSRYDQALGGAITDAAQLFGAAALGTAASNVTLSEAKHAA